MQAVASGSFLKQGVRVVARTVVPSRVRRAIRGVPAASEAEVQALVTEIHRLSHLVNDLYDKLGVMADHLPAVLNSISVQNDAARRAARIEGSLQQRIDELEARVKSLAESSTTAS
jgi:polyhydroxyalkanoate synthesis regulator phasin